MAAEAALGEINALLSSAEVDRGVIQGAHDVHWAPQITASDHATPVPTADDKHLDHPNGEPPTVGFLTAFADLKRALAEQASRRDRQGRSALKRTDSEISRSKRALTNVQRGHARASKRVNDTEIELAEVTVQLQEAEDALRASRERSVGSDEKRLEECRHCFER